MEIIKTKLEIGAEKAFSVLHMTDTHLIYADIRDGERKVRLAQKRTRHFPLAEEALMFAERTAEQMGLPIVHTGDLIDFVSLANLEAAKRFVDKTDCFMAAGNHEFSLYVGEAKEDEAYRNQSLATVQAAFQNDIRMSSRILNGVNFVALDNGYYTFDAAQLAFLKEEVQKGLPVILLLHTPLYEQNLYTLMMQSNPCAYLAGVPEELMSTYPPERFEQQKTDEFTAQTMAYIREQTRIKAIIAGHLHFNYEGRFADRIPQVITSCTDLRLIEIN